MVPAGLLLGRHLGRFVLVLGLFLITGLFASPAAEPSPEEARAEAKLAAIEKRLDGASKDHAKLRKDLLAFRLAHPGTAAAIRAAGLLGKLTSALDRMDAATIPALEKFDWQPKELVAVLGEHRGRHGAAVTSVAFSSDGKLIASGGSAYVRLWDPSNMRLRALLHTGTGVTSVAFTKDVKHLVAGTAYGALYVWSLPAAGKADAKPALKFALGAATSPIYAVACHPDNKRIGAACFDNTVRVYDISGKELKELAQVSGHSNAVRCLAFSPDGKYLATGSDDLTARVWDAGGSEFKERSRMENHTAAVLSVAFRPSGTSLATGCADGTIRLWGVSAGAKARARVAYQGPKAAVTSLNFSGSGNTLVGACGDNLVRTVSVKGATMREALRLAGHSGVVKAAAFSPDMKLLVSGGDDWMVRTWDLTRGRPDERFVPASHTASANAVAFGPDDRSLASGSEDRVVRFWDLDRRDPKTRNYLKGDNVPIYAVAYSPDGALVAAAGQATRVRQWDANRGSTKANCTNLPTWTYRICYSADGRYLLASSGKTAVNFDATRGTAIARFENHETQVHDVAFSPDGKHVLTTSGYYLYDKAGKLVIENGKYVFTDCHVRVSDSGSGMELAKAKSDAPFYGVGISPDGKHVLAGTYGSSVRRWAFDQKTLTELPEWKGRSAQAVRILPTEDGRHFVTTGLDSQLILWDAASGKRLREWTLNEYPAGMAVTTDGRHLAVGLVTGVIYILRLDGGPGKK